MGKRQEQINLIWDSIQRMGKIVGTVENDVTQIRVELLSKAKERELREVQNHLSGVNSRLNCIEDNVDELKENFNILLKYLDLEIKEFPKSKQVIKKI